MMGEVHHVRVPRGSVRTLKSHERKIRRRFGVRLVVPETTNADNDSVADDHSPVLVEVLLNPSSFDSSEEGERDGGEDDNTLQSGSNATTNSLCLIAPKVQV